MSHWNDRVRNHAVWDILNRFGTCIDRGLAREGNNPDVHDAFERLRSILTIVRQRLSALDPLFVHPGPIDGISSSFQSALADIERFQSEGAASLVWNANQHLDVALDHLAKLNLASPPPVPDTSVDGQLAAPSGSPSSAADGLRLDAAGLQREIADLRRELAAERARADARIDDLQSQLSAAHATALRFTRFLERASSPVVWLSALFVLSRAVVLLFLAGRGTDLQVHRDYIARIIGGEFPFHDFFPEYPPLVLVYTIIPSAPDQSLQWYFPLFRGLCCLVDCGVWVVLLLQLGRRRLTVWQLVLYLLGTTLLGALLYDRIDIVLGAMLLVAAISLLDGRDDRFQLAIGLGIAFKLIPVVVAPLAMSFEWRRKDRRLLAAALRIALPTVLSFGLMAALGGHRLDKMFDYHLRRGIQIESLPASVEMIGMMFGLKGIVSNTFGCDQLNTAWERPLASVTTLMLAAMVLGSAFFACRRKLDRSSQLILLAAVLSGAVLCSKVLSPQYFLFLLPVLVMLPIDGLLSPKRTTWVLVAVIMGLTGVLYPWLYPALVALDPLSKFLVVVRNGCLAALTIGLFHRVRLATQTASLAAAPPLESERSASSVYSPELETV
jgi:hypothetical protein